MYFILNVYFLVPPKITFAPARKPLLTVGQNYTLRCNASGDPQPKIYWTKDGTPGNQLNVTGYQLHLVKVNREDAGSYRCTASNGYGSDATSVSIVGIRCKCSCYQKLFTGYGASGVLFFFYLFLVAGTLPVN